jgi:hypothetical protein
MRSDRLRIGLLSGLFFLLLASSAQAGEGDFTLDGEIDYHRLLENPGRSGVGLGLEGGYGLSDTFGILAQAKAAFIFGATDDPQATRLFASAGLGLSVTLDAFRAIPTISLLPTIYRFEDGNGDASLVFGLQAELVIDYLLNRHATVGVLGGYQYRADPGGADARADSFVAGIRGGLIVSR